MSVSESEYAKDSLRSMSAFLGQFANGDRLILAWAKELHLASELPEFVDLRARGDGAGDAE